MYISCSLASHRWLKITLQPAEVDDDQEGKDSGLTEKWGKERSGVGGDA